MSQLENLLLYGTRYLVSVDLSGLEGPPEVLVRPLTGPEAGEVEHLSLTGMDAQTSMEGQTVNAAPVVSDVGALLESQRLAKVRAVAYGLSHSGEVCELEKAEKLPSPWTDRLAQTIFRISGISVGGDEDTFRLTVGVDATGEVDGHGDAPAVPGGDTSGHDATGPDQAPA